MKKDMRSEEGWRENISPISDGIIIGSATFKSVNNLMAIYVIFNGRTRWSELIEEITIPEINSYHNGAKVQKRRIVYEGDRSYHLREDISPEEGILALLREEEEHLRMKFVSLSP